MLVVKIDRSSLVLKDTTLINNINVSDAKLIITE